MGGWIDCGALGPEVLIFGGPYSNLQATRALLNVARNRGFEPERVICTGDTVGYGAHPQETISELRDFGGPVIAGNCERQIGSAAEHCGCGFAPGSACDLMSAKWYAHASEQVTDQARAWMNGLPSGYVFTLSGRRYAVIHGGATDISRFLWPSSEDNDFRDEIKAIENVIGPVDGVIAGHCGVAFHRRIDGIDWINAGVIGMPAHDGRRDTRFAVLRATGPIFERLEYDAAAAARAMEDTGLIQGYHHALRTGWWPNEDVLPDSMLS